MRICFVTHEISNGNGQGRVNYEVVREALFQGHQTTIISSYIEPELERNTNVSWIKISVDKLPSALLQNIWFSQISSSYLKKNKDKFDIIKVNGAITKFESDINAVHFVHSAWLSCPYNSSQPLQRWFDLNSLYQKLYTRLNSYWEKKAFLQAKQIIAVSKQVQQELLDCGVSKEKITVILNGVDLNEFSLKETDRSQFGFPVNQVIALFAGDIKTSRKNLESVLYSLQNTSSLCLAVLGSTEGSPYPKLASELGVADRTYFLGYRKDISNIMRAVDFFVFPSRYEACSLVILEALASGLPVITAKSAGGSEIVTSDCGVVLQDPDDIKGLAAAMDEIGSNNSLRLSMSQSARTVAKQYSWSTMAKSYINLMKDMTLE